MFIEQTKKEKGKFSTLSLREEFLEEFNKNLKKDFRNNNSPKS